MIEPLSDKELLFISYLLDQGADAIFKRICEDMHPDAYKLFSDAEMTAYSSFYEDRNSGGKDYYPGYWCPQGSVQSLTMAHRIRTHLAAKYGLPLPGFHSDADIVARDIASLLTPPSGGARER